MRLIPLDQVDPKRASLSTASALVALAKARLGVPDGWVLSWESIRELLQRASLVTPWEWFRAGSSSEQRSPPPSPAALSQALLELDGELAALWQRFEGLGSAHAIVTAYLVCDLAAEEAVLGEPRVGLAGSEEIRAAFTDGLHELYDSQRLADLAARGASQVGVTFTIQRMVEGSVVGVAYTRHPLTGDSDEWLLRAGFGLASGVRRHRVPSDVWRVTRDGRVRDVVVVDKPDQLAVSEHGGRAIKPVPEAARQRSALSEPLLAEVLRLLGRAERHAGAPVCLDWAVAEGRVHLLKLETLDRRSRPERRRNKPIASELWSNREVGEAISDVPCPLTWSLLRRFSRAGLSQVLSAVGASVGSDPLLVDVRGRAYLNVGALTAAVCRLPFVGPRLLTDMGLEPALDESSGALSTWGLVRSALAIYDAQVRFGTRLGPLSDTLRVQRGHFAPLDPRLLSPDSLERVLCDVEGWLERGGEVLMRCYGVWLSSLLALRAIFTEHCGAEARRLEGDLLWGPAEIAPVELSREALALAVRHTEAARRSGTMEPGRDFLHDLAELIARHPHSGFVLMDPESPRWSEQSAALAGLLWQVARDEPLQALGMSRYEIARGRRERAEREWRRRVPMLLWPATQLLIDRIRELTKRREEILLECAQAIRALREVALDASRRMALQDPTLPSGSAFFLELDELHELLGQQRFAIAGRTQQRRIEQRVLAALPRAASHFALRAREVAAEEAGPLRGVQGSMGAIEGPVVRVLAPEALADLPAGAVLVVRSCDVGLAPLLPAVRAVVSEGGGRLSHGITVGRALGLPSVVGVEGALARLAGAKRVRVDADRAEVTVLE